MDKRRHFSRAPFECNSTVTVDGNEFATTLIDISLKGALITSPPGWKQDNRRELVLEIKLAGSDITMHMLAEVMHAHEDTLGLQFTRIDMDSISHLRRLMELNMGDAALIDREVSALCHPAPTGKQKS